MEKHSSENNRDGKIIARQGERLVFLENKVKELENKLVQERTDRIEDLQTINYLAVSNTNNGNQDKLNKIKEITADTLEKISNGIIKKEKELSSNTDQSIKN